MLSGSMDTVPSSYEDSAVLLNRQGQEEFRLTGDPQDVAGDDEDFEEIHHHHVSGNIMENSGDYYSPRPVSRNGSFQDHSNEQDDEMASSGILILGPSPTLRFPPNGMSAADNQSLSPQLSLPDSECLPTDLQSLQLESFHSDSGSIKSMNTEQVRLQEEEQQRHKKTLRYAYMILGGLALILALFMVSTIWLLVERRSWVQSNQNLQDRMSRMQSDWTNLANKWQMDQEASLITSQSIKASLQAQVEDQRRKLEKIYLEQLHARETQEMQRQKEEQARRQKEQEQRQREAAKQKSPPFGSKKSASKMFGTAAKTIDDILTETEDAILKWSDATHHRVRNALSVFGKKVFKVKDDFFDLADRTYHDMKVKVVKFWLDFYTAVHEPKKEGWVEKVVPVASGVLFVTMATGLTARFLNYYYPEEEDNQNKKRK